MRTYLSFLLVVLCFTAITAGPASAGGARRVYLADGAVIECQKVWRSGGKVMVKVNRDVLLDFSPAEVDLKKTFHKKGSVTTGQKKPIHKVSKRKATNGAVVPVQKQVSSAGNPVAANKPAAAPKAAVPAPAKNNQPSPNNANPKIAAPAPVAAAKQAAPSSVKVAAAVPQPPKPAPRPVPKYVPPPPPPPEPFYKNPLVMQAGGGGLLVVLLLILLVMRKKAA